MPKGDKITTKGIKLTLTDPQQSFVEHYCNNGYNASQAYRDAYPNCKGHWDKLGHETKIKPHVKKAIDKHKASITAKVDHDRDIAISLLHEALGMARAQGNTRDIIAATRELNAISNLHGQTITTETKESPIPEAEQAQITEAAKELTVKLARNTA